MSTDNAVSPESTPTPPPQSNVDIISVGGISGIATTMSYYYSHSASLVWMGGFCTITLLFLMRAGPIGAGTLDIFGPALARYKRSQAVALDGTERAARITAERERDECHEAHKETRQDLATVKEELASLRAWVKELAPIVYALRRVERGTAEHTGITEETT